MSFACACDSGYTGDGTACTDIDECTDGVDNDLDGDIDCADSDCSCQATCTTGLILTCGDSERGLVAKRLHILPTIVLSHLNLALLIKDRIILIDDHAILDEFGDGLGAEQRRLRGGLASWWLRLWR